jgi:hypothetical protein
MFCSSELKVTTFTTDIESFKMVSIVRYRPLKLSCKVKFCSSSTYCCFNVDLLALNAAVYCVAVHAVGFRDVLHCALL